MRARIPIYYPVHRIIHNEIKESQNWLSSHIEYQGAFHDGSIKTGYQTKEKLSKQQEHDKRKRDFALKQEINLLEIWYWDFDNIEQILKDKLHINNIEKSA